MRRFEEKRLGGLETPRLTVTRGPHAPPRRRGGTFYANARRYYPAVALHSVGAQVALVSHHVWDRLGGGLIAVTGRLG